MRAIPAAVVGIALMMAFSTCGQPPTGVAAAAEAMGATNGAVSERLRQVWS